MRFKVVLLYLSLSMVLYSTEAQKRKSKRKSAPHQVVTEEQLLKAETTFIEAQKQILLEDYEKAFELLMASRDLNPDNATVYFKLAEVIVKTGDNERGLEYINMALNKDPDNKYFYVFKAEILKAANRLKEAAEVYEVMLERIEGNTQYLFELAALYQYQNDWEKAIETYDRIETNYGLSDVLIREKQKIYLVQNDLDALVADWDRLIAQEPDQVGYVVELSAILLANGRRDEAEVRLLKVIEKEPENGRAGLVLAEIYLQKGKRKEALEFLRPGIADPGIVLISKVQLMNKFMPNSPDDNGDFTELLESLVNAHPEEYEAIAFAGDVYFRLQDKPKALEFYKKSLAKDASNYAVWQQVISMEYEQAQYDSVVQHCDEALELFPNQAVFYFYGGAAHYILKDNKRAVRLLEAGKKYASDPNLLALFYGQLGDAYNGLKEHVKSDEAYELALSNDSNNDHVLNNYSYFLSLRGEKLEKALEMSGKLVEAYPENATYLDTHGWVLYVMEDYIEAEKYLRKAAELDEDGTVIEHYGDVLFKLGQIEEAIRQWEKAKELGGTTDEIDRKIQDKMLYE